jgi:hypothetical protein
VEWLPSSSLLSLPGGGLGRDEGRWGIHRLGSCEGWHLPCDHSCAQGVVTSNTNKNYQGERERKSKKGRAFPPAFLFFSGSCQLSNCPSLPTHSW